MPRDDGVTRHARGVRRTFTGGGVSRAANSCPHSSAVSSGVTSESRSHQYGTPDSLASRTREDGGVCTASRDRRVRQRAHRQAGIVEGERDESCGRTRLRDDRAIKSRSGTIGTERSGQPDRLAQRVLSDVNATAVRLLLGPRMPWKQRIVPPRAASRASLAASFPQNWK